MSGSLVETNRMVIPGDFKMMAGMMGGFGMGPAGMMGGPMGMMPGMMMGMGAPGEIFCSFLSFCG